MSQAAQKLFRAGTLTYNRRQLAMLFIWLLIGDLVFMVGNQFEPRVLPILLKQAGASDAHIAWIVGTLIQVMQLVLNPIYSYNSDRTRSRWGRRIPYLFFVTPFVSLLLVLTPYAPDIAAWLMRYSWMQTLAQHLPCPPAVLMYGLMVGVFYLFYAGTSSIYFYLFRDVVPESHMGRFLALFRIVGALATFIFNYWLFGLGVKFPKEVFLGMAVVNFAGFMAMCWFVREGEYPPMPGGNAGKNATGGATSARPPLPVRAARSVVTYFRECFSDSLNWWTYICRLMVYASMTASSFLVFFPMNELGMSIGEIGRALSWPSLVWIVVAFPVGLLLDKWKVFRVLRWSLWIQSVAYLLSFFFIRDDTTFLISSLITGVMYWAIMLCQFMLGQEVFPALYLGQFFSANVVLQSVVIALVISPFCGWFFDWLKGTTQTLTLPLLGTLEIGPYRYIMLILSVIFFISLFSLYRVEAIMRKRGLSTGPASQERAK
ncbi:MAG: MFS transporter [Opitutaceae bacterium]|jgi:MFS family permease|nr:MFS transporter [Opitutaceae bacterium]